MAFTQQHLDDLDDAIATGATEVEYEGGKRVKFASLANMMARRRFIAESLGLTVEQEPALSQGSKGL